MEEWYRIIYLILLLYWISFFYLFIMDLFSPLVVVDVMSREECGVECGNVVVGGRLQLMD
jgi:hypothetical protein